ncbi:hypothetical protein GJAV_G00013250 [Gymnothorax javanicus]|nr:hypothetical protein GJAV_G00013250 [Gymnothorax javanicus]
MDAETDMRRYMRTVIKGKLQELGPCVDEELTDYIMVLVANKKNAHQMAEDLSLFLGRNSVKFTLWLHGVLEKLSSLAVEPGLLQPHYLQADSPASIGNGLAGGGGEERRALSLFSICSDSTDAQLSISPTIEHHSSRPRQRAEVTVPCGLGWPSQNMVHGLPSYWSSEAPQGTSQLQHSFRGLPDSGVTGDKLNRASMYGATREELMSWMGMHQAVSSIEHMRSDSEPHDAHCHTQEKSPARGSIRRKLATTLGDRVTVSPSHMVQGRCDEQESQCLSPKFIVTLHGAPSPLRNLEDNGAEDEKELYHSDVENELVMAKRRKVPERCRFWPACESGDKCSYHHPIAQCKAFPHCSFGDKCLFIHPDCKYNAQCTRVDCPYTHSSKRSLTSSFKLEAKLPPDLCHFFPECKKMDCQFYHPKPCRFATRCKRADCYFYHPPVPSGL